MKRLFCCVLLALSCSVAFSQKVYFVYLQTESEQPFFVRMNDKTQSSTASGYLILSRLRDSSYSFKLGFPQNKWPEQQFTVDIKGKDRGFLVKNFGEKGWGLFDLQTLAVVMTSTASRKLTDSNAQVSAFTDVLSKAANDPSLRDKPVLIKQEEKTVAPIAAVVKQDVTEKTEPGVSPPASMKELKQVNKQADSIEASKQLVNKEEIKKDSIIASAPLTKKEEPLVVKEDKALAKKEEPKIDSATAVKKEDNPVTTPLAIVENPVAKTEEPKLVPFVNKDTVVKKEEPKEQVIEKKEEPLAAEYKKSTVIKKSESSTSDGFGLTFVDQYSDGKKDTIRIVIPVSKEKVLVDAQPVKDSPAIGSRVVKTLPLKSCTSVATENDFLKLRKKMASLSKDEPMINEAKKAFKGKCYMTEQVKNLGNLFLNEAGKFQFFEAAYPFIVDSDKFIGLQSEFKDAYFIHRFKNLVN